MISQLRGTGYIAGSMFHITNFNTLKTLYFATCCSIMKYGIIKYKSLVIVQIVTLLHQR